MVHTSGKELDFIKEAFADNWVVPLGPDVDAFERDLETFVNQRVDSSPLHKKVAAVNSGTSAVHLALIACGVKPDDEVLVQSFTFCASSHPVTYLGATPVFVDSERDSWNMDPELLEEAIKDRILKTGRKPKAIIPVALYGMPYRIDRILEVANRYDISVIEDAAEGLGSRYRGQVLGTFGQFGVLSFNGNKMITTSSGGAVICDNEEAKKNLLYFATQARQSYPYYEHEDIGYNYRLSNICAAIGRGQMTLLDQHIAHHQHVQEMYCELFKNVDGVEMHVNPSSDFDSNFWLCTAFLNPALQIRNQENAYKQVILRNVGGVSGVTRLSGSPVTSCQPNDNVEALRTILEENNVESRPLWKPMHRQPVYRDNPAYVNGVSEGLFKRGICLPSGPWVKDEHVRYVVDIVKSAIS